MDIGDYLMYHGKLEVALLSHIAEGTCAKLEVACERSIFTLWFRQAEKLLREGYIIATVKRINVAHLPKRDRSKAIYKIMNNIELTEKGRVHLAAHQLLCNQK
jgi:hypothetical protein